MLIIYLYGLRIVHHTLVVDIINDISSVLISAEENNLQSDHLVWEFSVELLVCVFENGGVQLRSDDSGALRDATLKIMEVTKGAVLRGNKRIQYMIDIMSEFKNNKSKRTPSDNNEQIVKLRKWVGSIKTSVGSKSSADTCLHISLVDLLSAEKKGRWWKAGAAWVGRSSEGGHENASTGNGNLESSARIISSGSGSTEHSQLMLLANKMRMNTPVRRDVFVVMMSSSDAIDAFERLTRLDLKGKQDREIVRVLIECCAQEKSYNNFYAELAATLCQQNRQHKATLQFAFWDVLKTLSEDNFSDRRAINTARLLGSLVAAFHVPLSVLKVIDMSELQGRMILFLASFFISIFSSQVDDGTFRSIFDRVATSSDYSVVRDCVSFFLQKHFTTIPSGMDPAETKHILKRRKLALKIMSDMNILDIARGRMEEQDRGNDASDFI